MAAENHSRVDSNLKPSELMAAFKRSEDIDALLDEERELKGKEVLILILGKGAIRFQNSSVAILKLNFVSTISLCSSSYFVFFK